MKKTNHSKPCKDHLGNKYSSIKEMCEAYNIKPETYVRRRKNFNWSIEDSLLKPVKNTGGKYIYDHEGNRFKSTTKMCQFWAVDRKTFVYRINHGYSIREALTVKNERIDKVIDKEINKEKGEL